MPILMIALLALACFGGIGALLVAAVMLETKKHDQASSNSQDTVVPGGRPAT